MKKNLIKHSLKILLLILVLGLVLFINLSFLSHAETEKFFTISANPAEDCNTSMNFVWHTEIGLTNSYLIYTKKSDTNWSHATIIDGNAELNSAFAMKNAKYGTTSDDLKVPYEFIKNTATATSLEPGTEYMYKISDGIDTSDVRYFKTGNQEFNFVWISDFHAYYKDARRLSAATQAINTCINYTNNNVDFILSTGDIVAHGGTYQWWKQVSEASWIKNYMFCNTLGNHDWMTNVGTNYSDGASYKFMDACSNNPQNGFSGQENICYYFYYGDALFIVVNTETESAKYLGLTSEQFVKAQQDWVENVLQNNRAQYIFLMQHYQAFATSGAYQSSGYTRWHNICDQYGVDIFLSGNSHVYMRSLPIYDGEISNDPSKGTVYLVAPSSDGERGVTYSAPTKNTDKSVSSWSDDRAKAASVVEVTKDGIKLSLLNYDGEILDEATILPKRLPTSLEDIDLSSFNKALFEDSFKLTTNQNNIATPTLSFSNDASNVLRKIKVTNFVSEQIYYEGMILKNATNCLLNQVDKGDIIIMVELYYVDSTTEKLLFSLNNRYEWGNITNPHITTLDGEYILMWDEAIDEAKIKAIDIYLDDFRFDVLSCGIGELSLPLYEGKHQVEIVALDLDGDEVYRSPMLSYQVLPSYIVTFLDESGNILKQEEAKEGTTVTPPNYSVPSGYKLIGWDHDYHNIQKDLTIKPLLEKIDDKGCQFGALITFPLMIIFSSIVILKRKEN